MTYVRDMLIIVLTIILIGASAAYLIDRKNCLDTRDPDSFECFVYHGIVVEFTMTKTQNVAP